MAEMDFLQAAEEAARIGGKVLQSWVRRFTVREKSPANLVTQADLESQTAICEYLKQRFPDHGFLGEEGLAETGRESRFRWIIDPLDGTSNYVHRFPYYAVSVALEADGELLVGAILDPSRDELFSAARGRGAHLNGRPIEPSRVSQLSEAMVMASLPVRARPEHPATQRFVRLLPLAQTVQRTGSAALNLASVACGRVDAFWSLSLHPWDMAAGVLIVREAGGRVTRLDGRDFDLEIPDLLASNGTELHEQLQQALAGD